MGWRRFFQRRFDTWLEKRLPRVAEAALNTRSLFIFPAGAGFGFLLVVALLWLLATNYENNIVFACGALLGAVLVVAIFHSFANLAGLRLRVKAVGAGFPGDMVRVDIDVTQGQRRHRDGIRLSFPDSAPVEISLVGGQQQATATLFVPARKRGRLHLPRLTLESTHPLGLVRTWTHILLAGHGLVYPRPLAGIPQGAGEEGDTSTGEAVATGHDDFEGLKTYRPGESPARIAWKQLARGQGLFSKQFSDPVADPQWLDWQQYPGLDREARLSRLCHGVLEASRSGEPFGLRLPGYESALAVGPAQRDKLLAALALFESGEG